MRTITVAAIVLATVTVAHAESWIAWESTIPSMQRKMYERVVTSPIHPSEKVCTDWAREHVKALVELQRKEGLDAKVEHSMAGT